MKRKKTEKFCDATGAIVALSHERDLNTIKGDGTNEKDIYFGFSSNANSK